MPATKKTTKRKRVADDDADFKKEKRPASRKPQCNPYMTFANEMRERVKAENPSLKPTELAKLLGEKWRALTAAEKETYKAKSVAAAEKKKKETAEKK